jgi:putative ABC transport system substrate-binding protein
MEVFPVKLRDMTARENVLTALAHNGNGGLIVTAASVLAAADRELVVGLAARYKLPAIYPNSRFIDRGGLMTYAAELNEQYRRAAGYVDRILKGEKPANLPVQAPTKYQLIINLKTAKALGLNVPSSLLSRADQVIE